jgi:hypothetical protein
MMKDTPEIPSWVPIDIFMEYQEMRKEKHCKLPVASYPRFFKKLKKLSEDSNCSPEEIIDQSISNGWQGIFLLRDVKPLRMYSIKPKDPCILD